MRYLWLFAQLAGHAAFAADDDARRVVSGRVQMRSSRCVRPMCRFANRPALYGCERHEGPVSALLLPIKTRVIPIRRA